VKAEDKLNNEKTKYMRSVAGRNSSFSKLGTRTGKKKPLLKLWHIRHTVLFST
jgi:hypothetical protein